MTPAERIDEAHRRIVADKASMARLTSAQARPIAERIRENEQIVSFWEKNGRLPFYSEAEVRK